MGSFVTMVFSKSMYCHLSNEARPMQVLLTFIVHDMEVKQIAVCLHCIAFYLFYRETRLLKFLGCLGGSLQMNLLQKEVRSIDFTVIAIKMVEAVFTAPLTYFQNAGI